MVATVLSSCISFGDSFVVTIDLSSALSDLASAPDTSLQNELREVCFDVPDGKFHTAFSAYGATKLLMSLDERTFSGGRTIPSEILLGIKNTSVLLLRMYASLVYMRSDVLERGLDSVSSDSNLFLYKKLYRAGSKNSGDRTLPQHIRNALCHGSLEFLNNGNIRIKDKDFDIEMSADQINNLCAQVFRLYCLAYEARGHNEQAKVAP